MTIKDRTAEAKISLKKVSRGPNADDLDALAAMRRAAIKARRRAIETQGYVPTWRNGKIEYDTEV